jgi:hypothetical protein
MMVGIIGIVVNIVGKELIMKCCGYELKTVCVVTDQVFCEYCEKVWGHVDDMV